ncbi:MAG: hypothetical protein BRC47_11165 [Cyanobacteria bacterium QS_7_48_42]|nr:MAG: hypothetical protein BRC47_11165 [Cyanobacteria bacterium QS_7_48_42]
MRGEEVNWLVCSKNFFLFPTLEGSHALTASPASPAFPAFPAPLVPLSLVVRLHALTPSLLPPAPLPPQQAN